MLKITTLDNLVGSVDAYYFCVKLIENIDCNGDYFKADPQHATKIQLNVISTEELDQYKVM